MSKAATIAREASSVATAAVTREPAISGWLIEVVLAGDPLPRRYFAVAAPQAADAVELVLRYPGLMPSDQRIARRSLSAAEFAALRLRTESVRPYGWSAEAMRLS